MALLYRWRQGLSD